MNKNLHKVIFNKSTGLKYLLFVGLLCLSQITFANIYNTQDISGNLNTDLTGGIITSTQTAEDNNKNAFTTATLKATDIENHSEYSGEAFGIGISGTVAANDNPNSRLMNIAHENSLSQNGIGYGYDSGKEYSITKSGINTANIVITDKNKQKESTGKTAEETLNAVKTDVTTDNYAENSGSLNNNFDADRVQSEIDLQREVTQEFSRNVQDLNRRQNQRKDDLKAQLERNEITQQYYNEQVAIINRQNLALNMIAGGLLAPTDSVLGVATSTLAPAASYQVGQYFKEQGKEGSFEHIATHAVIGALTSAANGGNALSGAVSAGGAEYIAQVTAETLFQKDANELTADEKQTVSSIAQLVGVVSSSLNGDTSLDAYIGGTVATNAVENNLLNPKHSWIGNYLTQKSKNKSTSLTQTYDREIRENKKAAQTCYLHGNCESLAHRFTEWADDYAKLAVELEQQGKTTEAQEAQILENLSQQYSDIARDNVQRSFEVARNTPSTGRTTVLGQFSENWNTGLYSVYKDNKTPDYLSFGADLSLGYLSFGLHYNQSLYKLSDNSLSVTGSTSRYGWGAGFKASAGEIMTDKDGNKLNTSSRFNRNEAQERTYEFLDGWSREVGGCAAATCYSRVQTFGTNAKGEQLNYQADEIGVLFGIKADGGASVTHSWGNKRK